MPVSIPFHSVHPLILSFLTILLVSGVELSGPEVKALFHTINASHNDRLAYSEFAGMHLKFSFPWDALNFPLCEKLDALRSPDLSAEDDYKASVNANGEETQWGVIEVYKRRGEKERERKRTKARERQRKKESKRERRRSK